MKRTEFTDGVAVKKPARPQAERFPARKACKRCRRENRGDQFMRYLCNRGCVECQKADANQRAVRKQLGAQPGFADDWSDLI